MWDLSSSLTEPPACDPLLTRQWNVWSCWSERSLSDQQLVSRSVLLCQFFFFFWTASVYQIHRYKIPCGRQTAKYYALFGLTAVKCCKHYPVIIFSSQLQYNNRDKTLFLFLKLAKLSAFGPVFVCGAADPFSVASLYINRLRPHGCGGRRFGASWNKWPQSFAKPVVDVICTVMYQICHGFRSYSGEFGFR